MAAYPFVHILFWIAMNLAPQGASQITITATDITWTWTRQETGWIQSLDNSVWKTDANTVTSNSRGDIDKQDVSNFVKGVKQQDWSKTPSLKLGSSASLAKVGDTFVYTFNEGDPAEKRVVIGYKK